MEETVKQLFREVEQVHIEKGCLTDELLSALNFVFPSCLLQALDLVDKKNVCVLNSPSGRSIYQVS